MRKTRTFCLSVGVGVILLGAGALAADFNGDGEDDITVFKPASGLWAARGVTRVYFGSGGSIPLPVDLDGNGTDEIAVFKPASGLWAVRGTTRVYYGSEGDVPIAKGGYNPYTSQYDYVVKAGDGDDLERALESDTYESVFVPAGSYNPPETITVDHVTRISGESRNGVVLYMPLSGYLAVSSPGCTVEKLTVQNGGWANLGNFFIGAINVTVRDCRSRYSAEEGFVYASTAAAVTLDNC
jgi:hypothetical protein